MLRGGLAWYPLAMSNVNETQAQAGGSFLFDLFRVPEAALTDPATNFLYRWAGRSWLMLAVERAYNPGTQRYHHPVFVGPRRAVLTMLKHSLPPERGWFKENVNLTRSNGKLIADLTGPVLAEVRLDTAAHKREFERVKIILKAVSITGRPPRRRNAVNFPMRLVIIPTADSKQPLPADAGGNNMYVAVELLEPKIDIEAWMKANRNQLWAEALRRVKGGESSALPIHEDLEFGDALYRAQSEINERLTSPNQT